jgi:NADH-quinone oxidoreductase subunit C
MSPEGEGTLVETVARVLTRATDGTAQVEENYDHPTAIVPAEQWIAALTAARDELGATFFDWLTGVDELENGYTIAAFVCAPADAASGESGPGFKRGQGLLLKTTVPRDQAELPTATTVYRGANWHERETFEMFGVEFTGHPDLKPLLLPDGFEGHPLRKEFILAARVAKAWPGAKEPGESDHDRGRASPGRRRMLPPGVPGDDWLKPLPVERPGRPDASAPASAPKSAPGPNSTPASSSTPDSTPAPAEDGEG